MCLILINIFCNSDGRISPKINPIQNNYNSDVVKVIVKKELSVFRGWQAVAVLENELQVQAKLSQRFCQEAVCCSWGGE